MKGREHEAIYAARTIRAFLNGSCGDRDWDDFTSCSLRDPKVDHIRRRVRDIKLPVSDEEQAELLKLADEADRLAARNGS